MKRVPALDGLRGVAILLVLSYHMGWLPGGFYGVDLFFVLSGYLITGLLLAEWSAERTISFRNFYARRARRLLPALVAVCLFVSVLGGRLVLPQIAATLFYAANIVRATGHEYVQPLRPVWSLAEEEQFYLVWPVLLFGLLRLRVRPRGLMYGLAAAFLGVTLWRLALILQGASVARVFFSPDTRADPLILGCLLGVAGHHRMLPSRLRWVLLLAGGVLLGLLAGAVAEKRMYLEGFAFTAAAVASAALVVSCRNGNRLLEWRPLVWVGGISYALYLWQGLARLIAEPLPYQPLPAIALSFLLAWMSTRYIEMPFRRRVQHAPAATPVLEPSH